ncbi:phospholipase [Triangularia setosa]|uniref:Phospholipase n=1 Tax=Triangularia setosa TaxID=2587417 RepID=A0AAN6VWI0_9PEZI|nr:phospholipase [Podospora setosa]
MTVGDCIHAYASLSDSVFEKKSRRVTIKGKLQGRFDTTEFEWAVKKILVDRRFDENALLKGSSDAPCKAKTNDTVCRTSYLSPRGGADLLNSTKIWQAYRATSAAITFFDPIAIGPFDEEFVDGALGARVPALKPATLKELTIEAETTAKQFRRDHSNLDNEARYYRFNVDHGLEDVDLEESKKEKETAAATRRYVASQGVVKQMKACVNNPAGREC